MKFRNLLLPLLIFLLLCACEAPLPTLAPIADLPPVDAAQNSADSQQKPAEASPTLAVIYTAVPAPIEYCDGSGSTAATDVAPQPFLYQPFEGELSAEVWTSQMDHDRPDYTQNGVLSALGETMRFNPEQLELQGGTQAYSASGQKWFSRHVNPFSILQLGYGLLAYQSPSFETYQYYDGHDGHDFAVGGAALAAADGTVTFAGVSSSTLGRVVEIFHPQGYLTRYAHLAAVADGLKKGDKVSAGQGIGTIGGSAVVGGKLVDGYWGVHLHFSVFRWDGAAWKVVDPFGWDPWAGPDEAARERKQREDPLAACNGQVSFNLWVDYWPRAVNASGTQTASIPTQDRYVGGWLGAESSSADALNGQIAYISAGEIHLLDLSTSTDRQLTHSGENHSPAWSYDGKYLLYIHGQAEAARLVVLNDTWQQVADFPARAAVWANDSYQIYWVDSGHTNIYLSEMDGSGAHVYYTNLPDPSMENWEDLSAGPKGGLNVSVRIPTTYQGYFRRLEADAYQNTVNSYTGLPFYGTPPEMCLFSLDEARASGAWTYNINTGCMLYAPGSVDIFCEKNPDDYHGMGAEPDWSPDENYLVYRFMGSEEGVPGWDFMGLEIRDLRTGDVREIVLDKDAREPAWRP